MQVERERNLVTSKLMEFDKLRKKPESAATTPAVVSQNHVTSSAFSFGQRGTSTETSPMNRRALYKSFSSFSSFFSSSSGHSIYTYLKAFNVQACVSRQ